jgi:PKHD-type hydroxylase
MQTMMPPEQVAQPNDYVNFVSKYQGAFSQEECDAVIQLAHAVPSQEGVLDSKNSENYRRTRSSSVRFIDYSPSHDWVFRKLRDLTINANQCYRFDIHGFRERLQVAEYGVGDHFDWHLDFSGGPTSTRKLSVSVFLSDAADYEGGDLEFFRTPACETDRKRGTAIVFPSYLPHRVTPVTRGKRISLVAWVAGPSFR